MNTTEQKPQAEWHETTINISGPFGRKAYPSKELTGSGLGYWIGKDKGELTFYVPTHLLSGYKAASAAFHSEDICKQFLVELSQLMNWNQPLKELVKDENYQPDKFNALAKRYWIEDAGQTAGGGRW